ncbi:MAG: phosphohydrolase [Caldimicrobium sp.]
MRCPGQDWRYWREDAIFEISCPFCGEKIEFFKDDTLRKCPNCKRAVPNPKMDFGCAAYCKYADVCLGELPPELIREKANLLKNLLLAEIEKILDQEIFKKLVKEGQILESNLKNKEKSVGTSLLVFYFYFLKSEQREELYKRLNLPETLKEEIEENIKEIPQGLSLENLRLKLEEG